MNAVVARSPVTLLGWLEKARGRPSPTVRPAAPRGRGRRPCRRTRWRRAPCASPARSLRIEADWTSWSPTPASDELVPLGSITQGAYRQDLRHQCEGASSRTRRALHALAGVLCVLPRARVPGLMIVAGSGWESRSVGEEVLVCKGGID